MLAEVTYNKGATCQIKGTKFVLNRGVMVSDPEVIKRAKNTAGFSVNVLEVAPPKKKRRAVQRDSEGNTRRASKKATKKASTSSTRG